VRWVHQEPVQWITVVGVAADVHHFGLDHGDEPALYTPYAQFAQDWKRWMNVVVKSPQDPATLERAVKTQVWSVDPAIPITRIRTMTDVMSASLAQRRFHVLLLGLFAALALALAAIGVYGVTAYGVSRRTREIGLRMALGADRRDVVRLIVSGGMRFVIAGLVAGLLGALALSRLLSSLLFEVRPTDPPTYAAVAIALAAVALLACALPATRAARLDPTEALRG
jgi:putative ABC transport system permease protein